MRMRRRTPRGSVSKTSIRYGVKTVDEFVKILAMVLEVIGPKLARQLIDSLEAVGTDAARLKIDEWEAAKVPGRVEFLRKFKEPL